MVYLLVFVTFVRFDWHMGRYNMLGQLLPLDMVGLPVILLVTGFDPTALLNFFIKIVPDYQGRYNFSYLKH